MINVIGLIFIIYSLFLFMKCNIKLKNNNIVLHKTNEKPSICILIPAKDESKVIESLLRSIDKQTYKVTDTYVIVEDIKDKTVDICKKYNKNIIVRKNLNLRRKGYALDEALQEILKTKRYDLYFIFDADNVLDKDFIKNMVDTYKEGYDIAIGYRDCKNGNDNVISAVSSLTFSMINTMGNNKKIKNKSNVIISGTGFYIKGYLIDKWQGYPFHSLTEDYELSLYAILNELSTYYNDKAIYYDEQPTKYKQTVNQRVRWIKGYFESRKKYIPLIKNNMKTNNGSKYNEVVGVKTYIYLIIGTVLILLNFILNKKFLLVFLLVLFIYFIMVIITIIILKKEKLNLNSKTKLKAILFNPIYLITYIPCALKAIIKKEVEWIKIEHIKN